MFLNKNALLIGHRGLCAFAPENTLPSFVRAAKAGLAWVEFDIRLTLDGQLVVFHDDTLERTTNGSGWVVEKTVTELQRLDAGSWFAPEFKDTRILTLTEALLCLETHNLQANIEIKSTPEQAFATVEALLPILEGWPRGKPYPKISSFDHTALAHGRRAFPQLPIGYLMEKIDLTAIEPDPFCSINASHSHNTLNDYRALINQGMAVFVYTVNDPQEAIALFEAGVSGVFTDCLTPALLDIAS